MQGTAYSARCGLHAGLVPCTPACHPLITQPLGTLVTDLTVALVARTKRYKGFIWLLLLPHLSSHLISHLALPRPSSL